MHGKTTFMNGVTLQEFFPLVSRLAQQVRMPVVFVALKTTEPAEVTAMGIIECATVTVGPSGSVTAHSTLVDPEPSVQWDSQQVTRAKAPHSAGAPKFPSIYESLSRTFSTSLVIGLDSFEADVPVIYGNMVRYGLPIMAARHQLDLRNVWQSEMKTSAGIEEISKHYQAPKVTTSSASELALTFARVCETMLWRHGSDSVLSHLQSSTHSYLTPDMVRSGPGPTVDPAVARHSTRSTSATSKPSSSRRKPNQDDAPWLSDLRKAIEAVIERHGVVRQQHLAEIATQMDWTEAKVSIEIGRLLTRGKLRKEPFAVADDQALLALHLPNVVKKGSKDIKLKAVRDSIKQVTGKDLEYIQIRLGLKALNIWHD
ncbi:hypothetical protein ACEP6V_21635 [Pseudomonas aeruginosa]|uniref:hypothetical protein n=1 Tax=Pseudomonas aeruginosa TaxID=287 RepID=UPI000FC40293|nr:hypothetical protein [Pseudomonas aeruginosa]RUE97736.1 hypothetical protein IPC1135_11095 [Pseudomonas aeruginosa]HCF3031029.1 hypothetical protein [Pseudomonas aeruginosa]